MRTDLRRVRDARRRPRVTQYDYLHLRYVLAGIRAAVAELQSPPADVLDVFCGTKPYDELFPSGARYVGLDVVDEYGVADVVTDEFLPFPDASFDVVLCAEAFHYLEDPVRALLEMQRVLRPDGAVILTIPFAWEHARDGVEHRYTIPDLRSLLAEWRDVSVVPQGGHAVVWATTLGRLVELIRERLGTPWRQVSAPVFLLLYVAINCVAGVLDAIETRMLERPTVLPMDIRVTAARPLTGDGS